MKVGSAVCSRLRWTSQVSLSLTLTPSVTCFATGQPARGGVLAGRASPVLGLKRAMGAVAHPEGGNETEHTDHHLGTALTHASNFYTPGPLCHVYLECSAVLITDSDPQGSKRIQAEAWDSLCEAAGSRPGPERCRCEPGCRPSRWC